MSSKNSSMNSNKLIPLQAGDSSTNPSGQQGVIVPMDPDAQLDMDMGFVMDDRD